MLEGVEINQEIFVKAFKSQQILVFNQDLNDFVFQGAYSLVMISNQRIAEMDEEQHFRFFNNIRTSTKYLLIYDYTGADVIYPINFTRLQQSKGTAVSMALYVPYKIN
jgi:hypothetical protein